MMGTEWTGRKPLVGFAIPDVRFAISALDASSGYTRAGPTPGTPEAVAATEMVLSASGEQQDKTYQVLLTSGGHPDGSATWAWKESTDASDEYRGWNPPNVVNRIQNISPTAGCDYWSGWDVARTTGGQAVALLVRGDTTEYHLDQLLYEPDTDTWTRSDDVILYEAWGVPPARQCPALCALPDGSVLAFLLRLTTPSAVTYTIDAWRYSGGSWAVHARGVYDASLLTTPGRMRATASPDGLRICLVLEYEQAGDWLVQLASSDGGASFVEVDDWRTLDTPLEGWSHDLETLSDGRILMVYHNLDVGDEGVYLRVVPSPHHRLSDATPVEIGSGILGAEAIVVVDDDGMNPWILCNSGDIWYVYGPAQDDRGRLESWSTTIGHLIELSTHGPTPPTWTGLGWRGWYDHNGGAPSWGSGVAGVILRGRFLGLGWMTWQAGSATYADHLTVVESGGWTSVPMPLLDGHWSQGTRMGWGAYTVVAADVSSQVFALHTDDAAHPGSPTEYGWTDDGSWDAIVGWDATWLGWGINVGLGVALVGVHLATHDRTVDQGAALEVDIQVLAGCLLLEIVCADGVDDYHAHYHVYDDQIEIYDEHTAVKLVDVAYDFTDRTRLRIAQRKSRVRVWAWEEGSTLATELVDVDTLTDDTVTPSPAGLVRVLADTGTEALVALLWSIQYMSMTGSGEQDDLAFFHNPTGSWATDPPTTPLHGRPLTIYPATLEQDLCLRGVSGPGTLGDLWTLVPRYTSALRHLDPREYPSPQDTWAATSDSSAVSLIWDLGEDTVLDAHGLYLVGLLGVNFKSATWAGKVSGGGAFSTIATFALATDFAGLNFQRHGDLVHVRIAGASGTGLRYVRRGELVGGYVDFGGGVIRPIVANSEGAPKGDTSSRPLCVWLDPDSVTGAEATTGSIDIWPPSIVAILAERTTAYRYYRLQIAAQDTYENAFRMAKLLIAPIAVMGREVAAGQQRILSPNASVSTTTSGRRSAVREGPERREWRIAFGLTSEHAVGASAEPDYIRVRDGVAPSVATMGEVGLVLQGLLRQASGPTTPMVVLRIPSAATTYTTCPEDWLYGRIMSAVTRDIQMGYPGQGYQGVEQVTAISVDEEI